MKYILILLVIVNLISCQTNIQNKLEKPIGIQSEIDIENNVDSGYFLTNGSIEGVIDAVFGMNVNYFYTLKKNNIFEIRDFKSGLVIRSTNLGHEFGKAISIKYIKKRDSIVIIFENGNISEYSSKTLLKIDQINLATLHHNINKYVVNANSFHINETKNNLIFIQASSKDIKGCIAIYRWNNIIKEYVYCLTNAVGFNADSGNSMVSASHDETLIAFNDSSQLKIFDMSNQGNNTEYKLNEWNEAGSVKGVFSLDSKYIAVESYRHLKIHQIDKVGKKINKLHSFNTAYKIIDIDDSDGKLLASNENKIFKIDFTTGQVELLIDLSEYIPKKRGNGYGFVYKNGKIIAKPKTANISEPILLFDKFKPMQIYASIVNGYHSSVQSSNGNILALIKESNIDIFDMKNAKLINTLKLNMDIHNAYIVLFDDGRFISIFNNKSGDVRVFEVQTLKEILYYKNESLIKSEFFYFTDETHLAFIKKNIVVIIDLVDQNNNRILKMKDAINVSTNSRCLKNNKLYLLEDRGVLSELNLKDGSIQSIPNFNVAGIHRLTCVMKGDDLLMHYGLFNDKVPNNDKNIYHYVFNFTTKVTDKYKVNKPLGYVFDANDKYFTGYGYRCEYLNKQCTDYQNKTDADQYMAHTLGSGRAWNVSSEFKNKFIHKFYSPSIIIIFNNITKKRLYSFSVNNGSTSVNLISNSGYLSAENIESVRDLGISDGNNVQHYTNFYDVFNRPDIVRAEIDGDDDYVKNSSGELTLSHAINNPPPEVILDKSAIQINSKKHNFKYSIVPSKGGIAEVRIFHNGKLISSDGTYKDAPGKAFAPIGGKNADANQYADAQRSARNAGLLEPANSAAANQVGSLRNQLIVRGALEKKCNPCKGEIEIDVIPGEENTVSVVAFNRDNTIQSVPASVTFKSTLPKEEPHLWLLSVGINQFQGITPLVNAKKDALDFACTYAGKAALTKLGLSCSEAGRAQSLFKPQNIHVVDALLDAKATKANIQSALDKIASQAKPGDTFVWFVASHGMMDANSLFGIVAHDTKCLNDKCTDISGHITSNEILETSKKIKAMKQLMVLDTCHSGGLDSKMSGLYDARMSLLAKNMGLHMYASAQATEQAQDGVPGSNGTFTAQLLEGIKGAAPKNSDGFISVMTLGQYAKQKTIEATQAKGGANAGKAVQTPVIQHFGLDASLVGVGAR